MVQKIWSGAVFVLLSVPSLWAQAGGDKPAPPAQPAYNPAAVGSNVKMNGPQSPMPAGRLGRPAEAIVGDATGKVLVAAWETLHGTCGGSFGGECTPPKTPGVTAVGYSTDGGKTWTDLGAPFLGGNVMTSGRPWLDRGGKDNQTYFLASRAADVEAEAAAPGGMGATPGGSNQEGLILYRGRFQNGALTWTEQHLFQPSRPLDLLRSPSILAAKDGSGRVWLAHSTLLGVCGRRGGSGGQISVRRSLDEGKTWEEPVLVSPDEFKETADPRPDDLNCGNQGAIQILPSLAQGSKDELYLTWQHGPDLLSLRPLKLGNTTKIGFARSLDGGRTFNPPQVLATVSSMRENSPVAYSKSTMNDIPRIAVATGGRHAGRVYVTYTSAVEPAPAPPIDQLLVSSQIYLIYSDDQGKTWSKPVPLASDVPPKGLKRFWPTLTVRKDGAVDVIYMESQEKQITDDPGDIECNIKMVVDMTRAGRASSLIDVYWVQSTDGGATFGPPVRVTSETTNWCKVKYDYETTQFANFGDVLGIYTTGERTFVVWPDGREGVPDAYFAELLDYKAAAKPADAEKESAGR
jgi:hypothetical protein